MVKWRKAHLNLASFSVIVNGPQSCQQPPPIISQVQPTHTHTHTPRTQAVKIKQQQLLTSGAACEHLAKVNPPDTSSPCVSTAYLLRLPARGASVCCGVTKRPIMLRNAGIFSGVSGGPPVSLGTGGSERARLPPFITGRLPERCLCCSRLILPSGRGSGALTSLYQSSRKLSTTHGPGHGPKSPGGCAHTHTCTHTHRSLFSVGQHTPDFCPKNR